MITHFETTLLGETVEFTKDDGSAFTGVIREVYVGDPVIAYLVQAPDGRLVTRIRTRGEPSNMRVRPPSRPAQESNSSPPAVHDLDAMVNWQGLAEFLGTTVEDARKMSLRIEDALEKGAEERRACELRRPLRKP